MPSLTTPTLNVRVLEDLNFTPVNGKPIEISCYRKKASTSNSGIRSVNSEKKINHKDLHEISLPFGNILSCENLDNENHKSFIETYSSIGNTVSCKVATDASSQLKGCVEESKDKASKEHNGTSLNVKQISVEPFLGKQEEELSTLLVKNIGESTTDDELKAPPETFLPFDNSSKEDRIAQLQNFEKEIDHKAPHGTFPCSSIVSTDASSQSVGYGHAQFGGVDPFQKAIGELSGTVRELKGLIGEFNGIIGGLNNILGGLNGMVMNRKQACAGPFLNKQVKKLFVCKANCTNVFVENFCESTSEDDLKNIFGEFGLITSTIVMRNEDGTSKCLGFVNFENAEDATKAVKALNGQKFDRNKWCSGRAQKRQHVKEAVDEGSNLHANNVTGNKKLAGLFSPYGSVASGKVIRDKKGKKIRPGQRMRQQLKEAADKSKLYINNLDASLGDKELIELFSPFGLVRSCKVLQNNKRISRGSALVEYSSPEEASRAISEMNGKIVSNKPLYVSLSQRKEDAWAQLENLDKELHGKAHQSEEYDKKAMKDHTNLTLNEDEVRVESFRTKQEKGLPIENANVACVLVKNFCESTTEDKLKSIFCEFGVVTSTIVMRNADGTSKCFGFVSFENAVDASRAAESLNGKKFDNKKWYVRRADKEFKRKLEQKHISEQRAKYPFSKASNVSVNNPNDNSSNNKLSEVFSPLRTVKSCKVMPDRKGISKGTGLVAMSPCLEASRPLSEMNGDILVGKTHTVDALAQRKEDRIVRLQPEFFCQELLVPGMRHARPLMPNTSVPLLKQQQHGSCSVGTPTNACPMEIGPQPAPAISKQMLPRGRGYCYPSEGSMFSMGGFPLRGAGMPQPIPVGPLASSFANASQLGRGRCLVKLCARLLNNWSPRMQLN